MASKHVQARMSGPTRTNTHIKRAPQHRVMDAAARGTSATAQHLQRSIGNHGTQALLQRLSASRPAAAIQAKLEVGPSADEASRARTMGGLQHSVGNAHLNRMLSPVPAAAAPADTTPVQPPGEQSPGESIPADAREVFNPMNIRNRLIEAIDQRQVRGNPYDPRSLRRHIEFRAVISVLSRLTVGQVKQIEKLYAEHESPRSLRDDIFGGGESGFPSDLTRDQRIQIEALLGGTVADSEDASDAKSHQNEADAAELHALLYGDLEQAEVERVMAILRRDASQLTELIATYERLYVTKFQRDLWHLGVANYMRASLLLSGSAVAADAFKVRSDQYRIREIDAKIAELTKFGTFVNRGLLDRLREERQSLVDDVEQRVQQAAVEGRASATGKSLEAGKEAARSRVAAVLGGEATTVGGTDAAVIAAIANADPAAKVAAQLRRLLENDKLTPDALSMALRGLRDDAAAGQGSASVWAGRGDRRHGEGVGRKVVCPTARAVECRRRGRGRTRLQCNPEKGREVRRREEPETTARERSPR